MYQNEQLNKRLHTLTNIINTRMSYDNKITNFLSSLTTDLSIPNTSEKGHNSDLFCDKIQSKIFVLCQQFEQIKKETKYAISNNVYTIPRDYIYELSKEYNNSNTNATNATNYNSNNNKSSSNNNNTSNSSMRRPSSSAAAAGAMPKPYSAASKKCFVNGHNSTYTTADNSNTSTTPLRPPYTSNNNSNNSIHITPKHASRILYNNNSNKPTTATTTTTSTALSYTACRLIQRTIGLYPTTLTSSSSSNTPPTSSSQHTTISTKNKGSDFEFSDTTTTDSNNSSNNYMNNNYNDSNSNSSNNNIIEGNYKDLNQVWNIDLNKLNEIQVDFYNITNLLYSALSSSTTTNTTTTTTNLSPAAATPDLSPTLFLTNEPSSSKSERLATTGSIHRDNNTGVYTYSSNTTGSSVYNELISKLHRLSFHMSCYAPLLSTMSTNNNNNNTATANNNSNSSSSNKSALEELIQQVRDRSEL